MAAVWGVCAILIIWIVRNMEKVTNRRLILLVSTLHGRVDHAHCADVAWTWTSWYVYWGVVGHVVWYVLRNVARIQIRILHRVLKGFAKLLLLYWFQVLLDHIQILDVVWWIIWIVILKYHGLGRAIHLITDCHRIGKVIALFFVHDFGFDSLLYF